PSAKLQARVKGSPFDVPAAEPGAPSRVSLAQPDLTALVGAFPLPWSHYVRLLSVEDAFARAFYESVATRGGWSGRQLVRQVSQRWLVGARAGRPGQHAILCAYGPLETKSGYAGKRSQATPRGHGHSPGRTVRPLLTGISQPQG